MAWLVLEKISKVSLQYKHTGIFCDNDAAVNWTQKRSTSTSTRAGHLLRTLSLRLHINQATQPQVVHILGQKNTMADIASRSFADPSLLSTNKTFLQYFSSKFPFQTTSWKEYHLPKKATSKVTSCLLGQPSQMVLWMQITGVGENIGNTGVTIPKPSPSFHTSQNAQTPNRSSSSQPLLQGSGQVTTAEEILSEFQQLRKHWQPSQRPLNWLENTR